MKKGIAITLLLFSVLRISYAVDLSELRQLCLLGNYAKALLKLDEMNLPEAAKDPGFSIENDFMVLASEVYEHTLSKEKSKKLAEYYQQKAEQDKLKWPSLAIIQLSSYRCNEQYSEAQDLCIRTLVEKTTGNRKKTALKQYAVLASLTDMQVQFENLPIAEKLCLTLNNKAEELFNKADRESVKSLQLLADFYLLSGNLSNAQRYIEQLEVLLKGAKNEESFDKAALLIAQADLYLKKGEPAVASSNLKRAGYILEAKIPTIHPLLVKHSLIYAELAQFMGNYGKGYKHLSELASNTNLHKHLKFQVDLGITELYYSAKKLSYGLEIINAASIPADYSLSGPTSFRFSFLKTMALVNANKTQEALQAYLQLSDSIKVKLGVAHALFIITQLQLGNLYYVNGQYKNASKTLNAAIDGIKVYSNANHPYYIKIQQELALINWAAGNKKRAQRYFNETSENYVYQYNKVFAILSEKEKNIFYANIRAFYDKFNAFMLEEYKRKPSLIGSVYNNQLSNKAILFNSSQELKNAVYSGSDTTLITKLQAWNSLRENLAKAYKLMAEGVDVKQALIDDLEKRALELEEYIQLKASINKSKDGRIKSSINWYDVQSYLKRDEAAIEMIRINGFRPDSGGVQTNNVYYASLFLTKKTKRNPELIVIENGKELETKQNKYYRNLIKFKIKDTLSYVKYWKPIIENKKFASIKTIFISPDGIYNQINVNTLYNKADNQYVIDKYDISLLTNTKDIVAYRSQLKKRSKLPANSVLVGFPEYYASDQHDIKLTKHHITKSKSSESTTRSFRGDAISELPGTKIEIETIKGLLADSVKDHSTESYLAKDANEGNMKKITSPGILHVATHGFFNDPSASNNTESSVLQDVYQDNPLLLCGILLSGAGFAYVDEVLQAELAALASGKNTNDGILTAYEAMNMNLDGLELAILSACETGLGKVQNGEGVYGFQRALQTAGAKAILMSLWKVDDEATKKLMIYFYKYWSESGDKMKAFEFAQKKIKEEFVDPIYWGAFIMVGW